MTPAPSLDALTDPESLRDHDTVDVRDATHEVDTAEFADTADLDSHVVVGVADDRGILLQNDGHHGWTLPAFPVADAEDWLVAARSNFEALTGAPIAIEGAERLRAREYRVPETDDSRTIYNVVVRATTTERLPDDPESRVEGTEIRWFDAAPADAPGPVAEDVALFVE
jgi:hypothetical protein